MAVVVEIVVFSSWIQIKIWREIEVGHDSWLGTNNEILTWIGYLGFYKHVHTQHKVVKVATVVENFLKTESLAAFAFVFAFGVLSSFSSEALPILRLF